MKITNLFILFILSFLPCLSKSQVVSKCFSGGGLKYVTTIRIKFHPDNKVTGTVSSHEYNPEDEGANAVSFSGTKKGNLINVTFHKEPPIVGAASSWTNKPWAIKKVSGSEVLVIPFYAKNYETNKWGMTTYEYDPCEE